MVASPLQDQDHRQRRNDLDRIRNLNLNVSSEKGVLGAAGAEEVASRQPNLDPCIMISSYYDYGGHGHMVHGLHLPAGPPALQRCFVFLLHYLCGWCCFPPNFKLLPRGSLDSTDRLIRIVDDGHRWSLLTTLSY